MGFSIKKIEWLTIYKLFFAFLGIGVVFGFWINQLVNGIEVQHPDPSWTQIMITNFKHDKGDFTFNYFSYFTILSNLLVIYWFLWAGLQPKKELKSKLLSYQVGMGITTYITITLIIYNGVLLPTAMPVTAGNWIQTCVEHMIEPLAMIIYFVVLMRNDEKLSSRELLGKTTWKYTIFPIVWCVFNLVRGEFRVGHKIYPYQYFFLNVHATAFKIPGWVWLIIVIIIFIILLYFLSWGFNEAHLKLRQRQIAQKKH